jgi:hypothetical protein
MNFLLFCLFAWATIYYVLSPPPVWVSGTLVVVAATTGALLYVS